MEERTECVDIVEKMDHSGDSSDTPVGYIEPELVRDVSDGQHHSDEPIAEKVGRKREIISPSRRAKRKRSKRVRSRSAEGQEAITAYLGASTREKVNEEVASVFSEEPSFQVFDSDIGVFKADHLNRLVSLFGEEKTREYIKCRNPDCEDSRCEYCINRVDALSDNDKVASRFEAYQKNEWKKIENALSERKEMEIDEHEVTCGNCNRGLEKCRCGKPTESEKKRQRKIRKNAKGKGKYDNVETVSKPQKNKKKQENQSGNSLTTEEKLSREAGRTCGCITSMCRNNCICKRCEARLQLGLELERGDLIETFVLNYRHYAKDIRYKRIDFRCSCKLKDFKAGKQCHLCILRGEISEGSKFASDCFELIKENQQEIVDSHAMDIDTPDNQIRQSQNRYQSQDQDDDVDHNGDEQKVCIHNKHISQICTECEISVQLEQLGNPQQENLELEIGVQLEQLGNQQKDNLEFTKVTSKKKRKKNLKRDSKTPDKNGRTTRKKNPRFLILDFNGKVDPFDTTQKLVKMVKQENDITPEDFISLDGGGIRLSFKTVAQKNLAENAIKGSRLWKASCRRSHLFDKRSFEVIGSNISKETQKYLDQQEGIVFTKMLRYNKCIIAFRSRHRAAVAIQHGINIHYVKENGKQFAQWIQVKPYVYNAQVYCRSCGSTAHKNCEMEKCFKCAESGHQASECTNEEACTACGGKHTLRKCKIVQAKQQKANDHKKRTYADVLKLKPSVARANKDALAKRHKKFEPKKRFVDLPAETILQIHEEKENEKIFHEISHEISRHEISREKISHEISHEKISQPLRSGGNSRHDIEQNEEQIKPLVKEVGNDIHEETTHIPREIANKKYKLLGYNDFAKSLEAMKIAANIDDEKHGIIREKLNKSDPIPLISLVYLYSEECGISMSDLEILQLANEISKDIWLTPIRNQEMDIDDEDKESEIDPKEIAEFVSRYLACSCNAPFNMQQGWIEHLNANPDHQLRCVCEEKYVTFNQFKEHIGKCTHLHRIMEEHRSL